MGRLIIKIITWIPFKILFWTRVQNKREIKKLRKRGVIFVSNHRSFTDGIPLFFMVPGRTWIMARASLFKGFLGRIFKKLQMFPVENDKPLSFMRYCLDKLKRNKALLIFPEGTRNLDASAVQALKDGASVIALKANVPIVPVILNRAPRVFRLTKIKIGTPIDPVGKTKDELTAEISKTMADMLCGFEIAPKRHPWDDIPVDTSRAIVIRNKSELLLIKRNRPGYNNGADYHVTPGGHVDEGESLKDAVVREVLEETGIDVEPKRIIYKGIRDGRLVKDEMACHWACEYLGGEITIDPNIEEYDGTEKFWRDGTPRGSYEPVWVPLEQLKKINLLPEALKRQLIKDIRKYGTRLVRRTKFLTKD